MKIMFAKTLYNRFINAILAEGGEEDKFKEIGTTITDNEMNLLIHCTQKYHNVIYQIAFDVFHKSIESLLLKTKYGFQVKITFIEKKFSNKQIERFTYYYFNPEITRNRYLFKYISLGPGLEMLLDSNSFYFNKPENFTDNTDCKYQIDTDATKAAIDNFYYKKQLENTPKLERQKFDKEFLTPSKEEFHRDLMKHHFLGAFSLLGITCFSEKYDNKLMWDSYADGSKGICLVFDTLLRSENHYIFKGQKVKYLNSPPKYYYDATGIMEIAQIVFAKTKDYKYENEVRELINLQELNDNERYLSFAPKSLKAVILGSEIHKNPSKCDSILKKLEKNILMWK